MPDEEVIKRPLPVIPTKAVILMLDPAIHSVIPVRSPVIPVLDTGIQKLFIP
jgi:hypothetical protein